MRADVRVERLRQTQWAAWRDLRLEALQDTPIGFGERYADAVGKVDDDWRAVPLRPSLQLLAWDGEVPVGMAGGFCDPDGRPTVYAVYVTPPARGQGVLGLLLDAVGAWADDLGAELLRLDVHEDNAPAISAYRRCGFAFTGERRPYDLDPSRHQLAMVRATRGASG